jgi:hypothetical protein
MCFHDRCEFVVLFAAGLGLVCGGLDLCDGYSLIHSSRTAMECLVFYGFVAIVTAVTN